MKTSYIPITTLNVNRLNLPVKKAEMRGDEENSVLNC